MSAAATALQDELLDALVWRTIGGGPSAYDAALLANPGIARLGPFLPEGTVVNLPDIAASAPSADLVQLWD